MSGKEPDYYQPYDSEGEESDTGSDTGSETSYDSAAQRLNDPRYAIIRASGPPLNTVQSQLLYQRGVAGGLGSAYDTQAVSTIGNSPLFKDPQKRTITTLFSLKSSDRDKTSYPTSSDFSIRLPRAFKNITQIQIVQMAYQPFISYVPEYPRMSRTIMPYLSTLTGTDLSSALCCLPMGSLLNSIGINEVGRMDPLNPTQPLINKITVRPNRYSDYSLAQEMAYQMNNTPPFNLISYTDFRTNFIQTRSLLSLFNEPGLYFYQRSSDSFYSFATSNNTKQVILNQYYPIGFSQQCSQPTEQETFVAYYYPVLKEAMMSDYYWKFLNLNGLTYSQAYNQIVQNFQGLNSCLYYDLCKANLSFLTTYRELNTFKYNPIYEYTWQYDNGMKNYSITHNVLSQSIRNDLNTQGALYLTQAINNAGLIGTNGYSTMIGNCTETNKVVVALQTVMNEALTKVGIPYNLYTANDLYNTATVVTTQPPANLPAVYTTPNDTLYNDLATGVLYPSTCTTPYVTPVPPYDFGCISLNDLSGQSVDVSSNFVPAYYSAISTMNSASVFNSSNIAYQGITSPVYTPPYVTTNFTELYSTFRSFYSSATSYASTVSSVITYQNSSMIGYVTGKYGDVLPPDLLPIYDGSGGVCGGPIYSGIPTAGQVMFYTSNIVVQPSTPFRGPNCPTGTIVCRTLFDMYASWYSTMPPNYLVTTLPWKLGFRGSDGDVLSYNRTVTSNAQTTPYNIYVQLNIEKSLNNMAVATKENLRLTNEPVAESKVVLGKILTLGLGVGDVTQSIIQSPAQFYTPLGKLDNLHFTLLLDDLTPLAPLYPYDFPFMEWNATVQIDEEVGMLGRSTELTTIPTVNVPSALRPF
jgi:hypothetical protein